MTGAQIKIATVIPAMNEATSIGDVIREVKRHTDVIVVDDGSKDLTAKVARDAGAEVISHAKNMGYDQALETGMQRALELDYSFAITMDADGQHDPELLSRFIAEIHNGAEMVVGIRDQRQRFSESMFGWIATLLWGLRDPLCGMKGYSMNLLRRAVVFDSYRSIGTELAIRAIKSGCQTAQIQVPTRPRIGASRFGAGLKANWVILKSLVNGLLRTPLLPL